MTEIYPFIQAFAVLAISPLSIGLVKYFKARLQGRKGASPLLQYIAILSMFKKELVISPVTSWVFRIVPIIVFASALFLAFVLPLLWKGSAIIAFSHFVIVAGILMLGTIFLVFGGIDPGSAFGGMGSSREMTIAMLVEPTLLMVFAALALIAGTPFIADIPATLDITRTPIALLSLLALILVALAENARYPVDNPATHLELTMIHEAMILEYSGPNLALLEWAASIKLTIFALLISNLVLPVSYFAPTSIMDVVYAILLFFAKIITMMGLLAVLETSIVKMRFYRVHEFLTIAAVLAALGLVGALFFSVI